MTLDRSSEPEPLRIIRASAAHALARFRSVLFSIWCQTPSATDAAATYREALTHKRLYPSGGYLHIVAPVNAPGRLRVDEDTRGHFIRLVRECGTFSGGAMVVEATGFFGAAVRGTVAGVVLVARPKMPTKVFGSVDEAARWMATRLDAGGASFGAHAELASAVADVRSAMNSAGG